MNRSAEHARSRSRGLFGVRAGLFVMLVLLLSGCLKYDLALVVSDDKVDGTLIVAVARQFAAGQDVMGQTGEITPAQGTVTKEAYEDTEYVGSRYIISGVPITEIDSLSTDSSTRFELTRQGDEYVLDASIRFNVGGSDALPNDESFTAMVSFTFPGAVTDSNGAIEGNTVVWAQLRPDGDNSLTARASAIANGSSSGSTGGQSSWWIWVLAGGVVLAAGVVVALILLRKRRARPQAVDGAAEVPWTGPPQGGYDAYGTWVPAGGAGPGSAYLQDGQAAGTAPYYGTYAQAPGGSDDYAETDYAGNRETAGGSRDDTYDGPPATGFVPQPGNPHPDRRQG